MANTENRIEEKLKEIEGLMALNKSPAPVEEKKKIENTKHDKSPLA